MSRALRNLHLAYAAILFLLVTVLSQGRLSAQNNPYKIDDECYEIYNRFYGQNTYEGRAEYAEKMRDLAVQKGDKKAETISYVLDYIAVTRFKKEDRDAIEKSAENLKAVSLKYGYDQYYFYSYTQGVTTYLGQEKYISAINLAEQMLEEAGKMNSDFGYWSCYKAFANIYLNRLDKRNAKKYLLLALDYSSKVPDQPVSSLYNDLSSIYPYSNDTCLVYLGKALETAETAFSEGRIYLSYAIAYGFRNDRENFEKYYSVFKAHSKDYPLQGYVADDLIKLRALEDFVNGNYDSLYSRTDSLSEYKEFVSDLYSILAEKNGNYRAALKASQELNTYLHGHMSETTGRDIAELAEQMENEVLQKEISHKSLQLSRMSRIIILATLLFVLGLVAFMIRYTVIKTRINKRLMEVSKELENARDEAVKANSMKTQFIQNMSHEIRTPLNAIVGFSQLLGLPDGLISEEEKNQYMEYVRSNSDMLTMLVDDILNIADMEHGNFRVDKKTSPVNLICTKAMKTVQYRVPPGVDFTFSSEADDTMMCTTDDRRAQQILINFLTNACKHTEKGEIHMECSLSENPGMITFSVSDTGPGVPEEMAEKIFDRFIKLNSFKQGTGLGLHICRQVASRLDGKVFLDTSYKKGARFVFVIPR